MLKVAAAMGLALAAAYFALPEFRGFVLASAPILAVLICPAAMFLMMLVMRGESKGRNAEPQQRNDGSEHRDDSAVRARRPASDA